MGIDSTIAKSAAALMGALVFGLLLPVVYLLVAGWPEGGIALIVCAAVGVVLGAAFGWRFPWVFRFFLEIIMEV